nr:hypothetical protein [Actinocrispum wychmicini]
MTLIEMYRGNSTPPDPTRMVLVFARIAPPRISGAAPAKPGELWCSATQ